MTTLDITLMGHAFDTSHTYKDGDWNTALVHRNPGGAGAFAHDGKLSEFFVGNSKIVWDNLNIKDVSDVIYHGIQDNPHFILEVSDDSKPIHFYLYEKDILIDAIEIDPLHNNGIVINDFAKKYWDFSSMDEALHVNPI